MEPDDRIFRREASRLLATLTRILGVHNLALAEDVVQDTLTTAVEVWSFEGVPEHYSAWLMTSAKNRAFSVLRREATARKYAPELERSLNAASADGAPELEAEFGSSTLADDELRMMFSCCHPQLPEDGQVALILSLCCGFSVAEVASAFLVGHAAMEKRISRGKKVLAKSRRLFELSAADFAPRLAAVQRALYLLFSEGYHGASAESVVRADLCREALRLASLLVEHRETATPASHALAALMHLHAARLPGRLDEAGNLRALFEQDRSAWDGALIARGLRLLEASASGDEVSEYHVEAGIAATHAVAPSAAETRWGEIVALYDTLLTLRPSPVFALNRAVALAQALGPEAGLAAIEAIPERERLAQYPFLAAAIGELELRRGRMAQAHEHFCSAYGLARNDAERRFLARRIAACDPRARC